MTVFLSLLFFFNEDAWLEPDELYLPSFLYSTEGHCAAIFTGMGLRGTKACFFDFNKGKVRVLDDGRINMTMSAPMPTKNGFALIDFYTLAVYHLDKKGNFVKKTSLKELTDWPDWSRVHYLFNEAPSIALLTIVNKKDNQYLVARMNLEDGSLKPLHREPVIPFLGRKWFIYKDRFYHFTSQTEEIVLLDDNFKTDRTLRKARPLLERKKKRRNLKYESLLLDPRLVNGNILFRWDQELDRAGNRKDNPTIRTMRFNGTEIGEMDEMIIGSCDSKQLVFHWTDKEFLLQEREFLK